jgi:hypothetical protein
MKAFILDNGHNGQIVVVAEDDAQAKEFVKKQQPAFYNAVGDKLKFKPADIEPGVLFVNYGDL